MCRWHNGDQNANDLLKPDLWKFDQISCYVWLPIELRLSQLSSMSQGTPVLVSLVKHVNGKPLSTIFPGLLSLNMYEAFVRPYGDISCACRTQAGQENTVTVMTH